MELVMEAWRRFVIEAKQEDDDKGKLEIDLDNDNDSDDFEEGDEVEIDIIDSDDDEDDETIEEWEKDKEHSYKSRKRRRKDRMLNKPDRGSWTPGADELARGGLARGYVGLDALEERKKRKPQCHAYNGNHGLDGRFVDPYKEKGSYSVKPPDSDSPKDCDYGKAARKSANRSHQWTKQPCGRDGKYRCKDGSEKYEESLNLLEDFLSKETTTEGNTEQLEAYLSGVISRELDRAIKKHMTNNTCSMQQLVRAMDLMARAEKGDLFSKGKDK